VVVLFAGFLLFVGYPALAHVVTGFLITANPNSNAPQVTENTTHPRRRRLIYEFEMLRQWPACWFGRLVEARSEPEAGYSTEQWW